MDIYGKLAIKEETENLEILNSLGVKLKFDHIKEDNYFLENCLKQIDIINHIPAFKIPDFSNKDFSIENRNDDINTIMKINSVKNFNYNEWRINNNLPEIKVYEIHNYLKTSIVSKERYTASYFGLKEIEEKINLLDDNFLCLKNFFSEGNFVEISFGMGSSFTLELPYSKKSFVCLNKDENGFEKSVYFLHELGHVYHNDRKFRLRKMTSIETDESVAHLIEYYLATKILSEEMFLLYKNILVERWYKCVLLTIFQMRVYQAPKKYESIESKEILFQNILKENYLFDVEVPPYSWAYEVQLIQYPFYSGSYIYPMLNVLNLISHKKQLSFSELSKLLKSYY